MEHERDVEYRDRETGEGGREEMNPIKLSLKLIPIETKITFGGGGDPVRKIRFALADEPEQEIVLSNVFPDFENIWKSVTPDIKIPPPCVYITELYERYQG